MLRIPRQLLNPLAVIACLGLMAANPSGAHHVLDDSELVWFVVFSDTHIGANLGGYGEKDTDRLDWATGEMVNTIQPEFIINAGDLTDATNGFLIPTGQKDGEWESYRGILDANGMTPDFYYDIPGNHDHYSEWPLEHYLTWSMQGSQDGQLNHAWTHTDATGQKYLFIGLATCASNGAIAPFDDAGLDETDLTFLGNTLEENADADIVTVFGHHPLESLNDGHDEFYNALAANSVSAYIFGHTHEYATWWENATVHVNIDSITKGNSRNIALVAFDGLGMSVNVFDVQKWPQVMITAPVDAELGENHLYDYMISNALPEAKIRALAFHPDGVASATAVIDSDLTIPMVKVGDRLWEAPFDPREMDPNVPHVATVTINAGGTTASDEVVFYLFEDDTPIDNPEETEPSPEWVEAVEFVEAVEDYEVITADWVEESADVVSWPESDYEIVEDTGVESDIPGSDIPGSDIPGSDIPEDEWKSDGVSSEELAEFDFWGVDGTADGLEEDIVADSKAMGQIPGPKSSGCSSASTVAADPAGLLLIVLLGLLVLFMRRWRWSC